jgi:hypothetical protein
MPGAWTSRSCALSALASTLVVNSASIGGVAHSWSLDDKRAPSVSSECESAMRDREALAGASTRTSSPDNCNAPCKDLQTSLRNLSSCDKKKVRFETLELAWLARRIVSHSGAQNCRVFQASHPLSERENFCV